MRDRLLFLEALVELLALQHLRDGKVRRQPDDALEAQRAQPFGVEAHLGLVAVEDAEDLLGVGLRVRVDLLPRQRLARGGAARRVADERGEVADQEDDLVAQVLEVLELAHQHGVAQVQVGRGRVETGLHAQGAAGLTRLLEALAQIGDADDLRRAFLQVVQLFVNR